MGPRFDTSNINWKWVFISILIFFVVQILLYIVFAVFGILTLGIGFLLFFLAKPLAYFVGGYLTGRISPGITMTEPALGTVIITVLSTLFDASRSGRVLGAVVSGLLAFFLALYGAYFGEKRQGRGY